MKNNEGIIILFFFIIKKDSQLLSTTELFSYNSRLVVFFCNKVAHYEQFN